jgi:predicted dehydrogenase
MGTLPRQLRAGIIGPSGIGRVHADALRRLGVEIAAVAASTPQRSRAVADELRVRIACESAVELAQHPEVDVVHVCTPNSMHVGHVVTAIDAGKHVVCEKPLATAAAAAQALLEAAREGGVGHAVAYNYRYFAMVRALRAKIANNELGRVHLLQGGCLSDELLRVERHDHWMFDPARMGPALTLADVGVHWWDLVTYVTAQPVVEVICARQAVTTGPGEGEDSTAVMLRLADGAVAVAAISGAAPGHGNSLELEAIGTRASASWKQEDPDHLSLGSIGPSVQRHLRTEADAYSDRFGSLHLSPGHIEGYLDAFRELIGSIYSGFAAPSAEPAYPTFEDGVTGMRILEALIASADSGKWEPVG